MKNRKPSPLLYSLATLVIMLAIVLVGQSFAPDRVQITILGTTDLHGNINPIESGCRRGRLLHTARITLFTQTHSHPERRVTIFRMMSFMTTVCGKRSGTFANRRPVEQQSRMKRRALRVIT